MVDEATTYQMILAVCPNTAIDRTAVIAGFAAGKQHKIARVHQQPGGKGVNAARVLKALGQPVLVIGFVGGETGRQFAHGLQREGISAELVRIAGPTRTCLAIVDPRGHKVTEIDELGPEVNALEVQKLNHAVMQHLGRAHFAIFSGSLPPGAPVDLYRRWVELAHKHGVLAAVDAAGPILSQALAAHPYLTKPNQQEAEEHLGYRLSGESAIIQALETLAPQSEIVAITLGARGAAIAVPGRRWRVHPPSISASNTVGCGDAFLAGFLTGLERQLSPEDASRLAIAAGAANALTSGAGTMPAQQITRLETAVQLFPLD
ncbi:MAG: 1-phosphofructokinase family hexose kinase [Cyanobacteria bacterium NC_groundwater_1444_Ag_S-0.65um_54_12]|nr:1-phosphofructokinase family hexose kinase [Cyanobacteria bacterium NC_groundwater_1444_Ag_S-0.65um_54_12]